MEKISILNPVKVPFQLEICCYSVTGVRRAAESGAHRAELCSNRPEGGTTPSAGMILQSLEIPEILTYPIIRPRGGDFFFNEEEFELIVREIEFCKNHGVQGIVCGILKPDGQMDVDRMKKVRDTAGDMDFTLHRAIDMSRDVFESIELLKEIGIKRVLSSGGKKTAEEGAETLGEMQRRFGSFGKIMAGAGVNTGNLKLLWNQGIREFHSSAGRFFPSQMHFKNQNATMGSSLEEFTIYEVDEEKVRDMRRELDQLAKG